MDTVFPEIHACLKLGKQQLLCVNLPGVCQLYHLTTLHTVKRTLVPRDKTGQTCFLCMSLCQSHSRAVIRPAGE